MVGVGPFLIFFFFLSFSSLELVAMLYVMQYWSRSVRVLLSCIIAYCSPYARCCFFALTCRLAILVAPSQRVFYLWVVRNTQLQKREERGWDLLALLSLDPFLILTTLPVCFHDSVGIRSRFLVG